MVIDGNKIANDILAELKQEIGLLPAALRLAVITCAPNFETQKFLAIKMRKAKELGIEIAVIELPENIGFDGTKQTIRVAAENTDGVVVQLPFPEHIDRDQLIGIIPKSHDVDAFTTEDDQILPPVVGAMKSVLAHAKIPAEGKRVVIIGNGKLVGEPAARWFRNQKASVEVLTKRDSDIISKTKNADIIVLGAGVPGLLKPDMITEGVVILDAGTSEESGELKGDADPACAEKALVFTPVPGGIGPITVAVLLRNLVLLHKQNG